MQQLLRQCRIRFRQNLKRSRPRKRTVDDTCRRPGDLVGTFNSDEYANYYTNAGRVEVNLINRQRNRRAHPRVDNRRQAAGVR